MALHLGEEIGAGAIGRVVEVLDDDDTVVFAGKILHDSYGGDAAAQVRFANEAALLKDVAHANLVRIFGIESIEGCEVLLMERIVGDSLATLIARGAPLPQDRIVVLGRGLAAGLAAAHHAGLIHRDLKPANVLVTTDDVPKIVDFGMARASSFAGIDDDTLAVVGTPAYMAPETIDPLAVDSRSDIYALGCILFEMVSGRLPFTGATSFAILENHRTAERPALPATISQPLAQLILRLLAKSPADRPQSAAAVEEEFASIAEQRSTALVKAADHQGRCASCGDALVSGIDVCFGCGTILPSLCRGNKTVFVVGPGEVASKLDVHLRQSLLDWLRANPSLGLDPTPLAKKVPRIPFALAIRVSDGAAEALAYALASLGLESMVVKGGRFSLPSVRKKAWKLSGRIAMISVPSTLYIGNSLGAIFLPLVGAMGVASVASGWVMAGRRSAHQGPARRALPPVLAESVERVAGVLPAMTARRHRHNLRAVVQRVLALREFFRERKFGEFDAELAQVLDLAVVASARIDELEDNLSHHSLRDANEALRAALRERDMWAARLMATTASLESMRARYVASELALEANDRDSVLTELRHQVAALREVEDL